MPQRMSATCVPTKRDRSARWCLAAWNSPIGCPNRCRVFAYSTDTSSSARPSPNCCAAPWRLPPVHAHGARGLPGTAGRTHMPGSHIPCTVRASAMGPPRIGSPQTRRRIPRSNRGSVGSPRAAGCPGAHDSRRRSIRAFRSRCARRRVARWRYPLDEPGAGDRSADYRPGRPRPRAGRGAGASASPAELVCMPATGLKDALRKSPVYGWGSLLRTIRTPSRYRTSGGGHDLRASDSSPPAGERQLGGAAHTGGRRRRCRLAGGAGRQWAPEGGSCHGDGGQCRAATHCGGSGRLRREATRSGYRERLPRPTRPGSGVACLQSSERHPRSPPAASPQTSRRKAGCATAPLQRQGTARGRFT
jgi:hypothetical protein